MKKIFLIFILFFCIYTYSAVKLERKGKDIVVENEKIKIVISPERGGAVTSFIYKKWEKDIIPQGRKYMGLFMDHLWGQTWPGELLEVPYQMEILKNTPEEVKVRVKRKVSGIWRGIEQKIIKGIVIEKTYTIYSNSEKVICSVKVLNPTDEGKLPAYWVQNVFFIGGDYDAEKDVFYRPSCRGVRKSYKGSSEGDFMKDPYAGWSAAIDTEKKEGIVFLVDYNWVDMLYDCNGNLTLECMYDKVPVPSGREWDTEITAIPFTGFKKIVYASENFICDMNIERKGKKVEIVHTLRGSREIKHVKITTEIFGVIEKEKKKLVPVSAGEIGQNIKEIRQVAEVPYKDPLVIFVKLEGKEGNKTIEEKYFDFYAGKYAYGDNIQQDMITPVFKVKKPEKKQILMRPEKIVRKYDDKLDIFIMKGLNTDAYGIEKVIENLKKERKVSVNYGFYSIGQAGPRITDFPFDYGNLMSQDIIIIANVNIQCLGNLGLEMLKDYIENGGNVLFLGGKSSYGNGGIKGTVVENVLPFSVSSTRFDISDGKKRLLVFKKSPLLKGIDLRSKIFVSYIHNVEVKEGDVLIKTQDNKPFLLIKNSRKGGKIACIFGAPYGKEKGYFGTKIFYKWSDWDKLMEKILLYLGEK